MVSALNIIGNDESLQEHWFKRFIAIVIDNMIFWAIGSVLTWLFINNLLWNIPFAWTVTMPLMSGGLFFLYAFALEASSGGATLGKKVMNLRVISTTGEITMGQAAMRNVSKVYGPFLALDWLVGFVTDGDPKQKWLDRVAGTTVVVTTTLSEQEQHTYQAQQAKYAPPPQEKYQRHEQSYQYPPPPPPTSAQASKQTQGPDPEQEETCKSCGGRMTMTGKGRLQCIRCGKIQ